MIAVLRVRRLSLRTAISAFALVVISLTHAARARACSCVEAGGVKEALESAGSVFEGKVRELRHDPTRHRITAHVSVLRRWKGADAKSVDVVTIDQGSLCGFGFERGKTYLLFTPEAEGTLSVGLCSRSKASEWAGADFTELDRLTAPEAGAPAPSDSIPKAPEAGAPHAEPAPASRPQPTAPEPPAAAAEPRRGGCAGCTSAGSSFPTNDVSMIVALALGVSILRRRATVWANRA